MVYPANLPSPLLGPLGCVIQFQSDTAVAQGHLTGRVERMVSGQATDFQSPETRLTFGEWHDVSRVEIFTREYEN